MDALWRSLNILEVSENDVTQRRTRNDKYLFSLDRTQLDCSMECNQLVSSFQVAIQDHPALTVCQRACSATARNGSFWHQKLQHEARRFFSTSNLVGEKEQKTHGNSSIVEIFPPFPRCANDESTQSCSLDVDQLWSSLWNSRRERGVCFFLKKQKGNLLTMKILGIRETCCEMNQPSV